MCGIVGCIEQPPVIRDTVPGIRDFNNYLPGLWRASGKNNSEILILACGTSYHAGLIGKHVIEEILSISVRVELASEVNHRNCAESYAAGELKHGSFSLVQQDTPVVAIVAQVKTYSSMLTNIK
ncbi:MAG: SIS domain-containing protein [Dehalococcoidales bacterium]|nr:SIS domain-containing protein [Dehalococcoidales bacterium]